MLWRPFGEGFFGSSQFFDLEKSVWNAGAEPVRFSEEQQVLPVEAEVYPADYAASVDGVDEIEAAGSDPRRFEAREHYDGGPG